MKIKILLILLSLTLVSCVKTVPIDQLNNRVILSFKESIIATENRLMYIETRDSIRIYCNYVYKTDLKSLKEGDTIKIK